VAAEVEIEVSLEAVEAELEYWARAALVVAEHLLLQASAALVAGDRVELVLQVVT
jgi:hypothetical protein